MPIYEYICEDHGRFEVLTGQTSRDEKKDSLCPICHKTGKAVLTAPARTPDKWKV